MRVFVVKYDSTEPYDPGTVVILGAYTSKAAATERIDAAKLEVVESKCVDYEASHKAGLVYPNCIYKPWSYWKYGPREDYFEIVEMELDDGETPIQADVVRSGGATECAPIAGHPSL